MFVLDWSCAGTTGVNSLLDDKKGARTKVSPLEIGSYLSGRSDGVVGHIGVFKMDTEGYEPEIFQMLLDSGVLQNIKHILVELTPSKWASYNISKGKAMQTFRRMLRLDS